MHSNSGVILAVIAAALFASPAPAGTLTAADIDKAVSDLAESDYGSSHAASQVIMNCIIETRGNRALRSCIEEELIRTNIPIPQEKWFTNLTRLGNVGAASIYFMLEELFHSDKLKKGQKILCMVPESARFSYVYVMLTAV